MSEEMAVCPYNKYHVISTRKLAAHLCKCRRQYGGKDYTSCPFNSTHVVLKPELQYHVQNCPDKIKLDSFVYVVGEPMKGPEVEAEPSSPYDSSASENWEERNGPPVSSYLDVKDKVINDRLILRKPSGMSKAERKKFVNDEIKRFQQLQIKDDTDQESSSSGQEGKQSSAGLGREVIKDTTGVDPEDDDCFVIVRKKKGRGRAVN